MIGAIALHSAGIPSSALISGLFSAGTENPMTQEPSPMAWAASMDTTTALRKRPNGRPTGREVEDLGQELHLGQVHRGVEGPAGEIRGVQAAAAGEG